MREWQEVQEMPWRLDMDLKDTYNKIALNWHNKHSSDDWWVNGVNKFISFFNNGDEIFDVGCGSGNGSKYLIKNGLKVTGVDFAEKMVELAQKQNPEAIFFYWILEIWVV